MAVTKLMCLKQAKNGKTGQHLENCLNYVLNMEKTDQGQWIGGNCGTEASECLQCMMETKKAFLYQRADKLSGRQGYHFIISLPPGEGGMEALMQVTEEFCAVYLGDDYDYVYAGHSDKAHKHAHIVFNAVSRTTGRKYHYKDGDWQKDIQPLVNGICLKYGLSTIDIGTPDVPETLHKTTTSPGNYIQWKEKQLGKHAFKEIIKKDIERFLPEVETYQELLEKLRTVGYEMKAGHSKNHGSYFSIQAPGAEKNIRSYQLGEDYSPAALKERISKKGDSNNGLKTVGKQEPFTLPAVEVYRIRRVYIPSGYRSYVGKMSAYQAAYLRRIRRARNCYQHGTGKQEPWQKDYHDLKRLSRELCYLCTHRIQNKADLGNYQEHLEEQIKSLKEQRSDLYRAYSRFRKRDTNLFALYEQGRLSAEQFPAVENAYVRFQSGRREINTELKKRYKECSYCRQIAGRIRETKSAQTNRALPVAMEKQNKALPRGKERRKR